MFVLILLFFFALNVESKVLFDGNAAKGVENVWKILNFEGKKSTITVVDDEKYGKVWKFYKPKGDHRAEGHGAKGFAPTEGDNFYIGWLLKLEQPLKLNTFANFQWKAYGSNMKQNYPFKVKANKGRLVLEHNDGKNLIAVWTTPLKIGKWVSLVLRIKLSRSASDGYVQFWYNGEQQTLLGGSKKFNGRSLDAEYCDPKWGAYGGDDGTVTTYVSSIKIATTFEEAAPRL